MIPGISKSGLLGGIGDGWLPSYSGATSGADNGWSNATLRILIPATAILQSGSQVRITLGSSNFGTTNIGEAWIGEKAASGDDYDMESGTQAQFYFNGSAGVTMASLTRVRTDPLTFAFDETKDYVFGFYITSGGILTRTVFGAASKFKGSVNEAGTANVSSYGDIGIGTNLVALLTKIEVKP